MVYRAPDGRGFKYLGAAVAYACAADPETLDSFKSFYPVTHDWYVACQIWKRTTPTYFDPLLRSLLLRAGFTEEKEH